MDDPTNIQLPPPNTGALLTEVVRAYLHSGNPSVLVSRILDGVNRYEAERIGPPLTYDERRAVLQAALCQARDTVARAEGL